MSAPLTRSEEVLLCVVVDTASTPHLTVSYMARAATAAYSSGAQRMSLHFALCGGFPGLPVGRPGSFAARSGVGAPIAGCRTVYNRLPDHWLQPFVTAPEPPPSRVRFCKTPAPEQLRPPPARRPAGGGCFRRTGGGSEGDSTDRGASRARVRPAGRIHGPIASAFASRSATWSFK